jgi:hypothetical protein
MSETSMKWALRIRMGLWGGTILVALEVALTIVEYTCLQYCEQSAPTVGRIRFIAHPIADAAFNALVIAFVDGERRFLHVWVPTTVEAIRDAVVYNGLCFLEAFSYGLLLGIMASILFPRLTEGAKV